MGEIPYSLFHPVHISHPTRNPSLNVVGGFAAALALLATEASAAVHYVDIEDQTVTHVHNTAPYYASASFNPITGASEASTQTSSNIPLAIGLSSCNGNFTFRFGSDAGTLTSVGFRSTFATEGEMINGLGTWSDSVTPGSHVRSINFASYAYNEPALLAYRFKSTSNPTTYYYGWAEFSAGKVSNVIHLGVYSYAYEDSGAGIIAGAIPIPEPGVTAAVFGFVALAVMSGRRLSLRRSRLARA